MSTVEYPQFSALGVPERVLRRAVRRLGGRSARAPPRAAAGWPRRPRPAKPKRDGQTATPGERAQRAQFGGRRGSGGKQTGAMGASSAHRETARSVGAGRRARGTGWECSRRSRRAMCAEMCTVWVHLGGHGGRLRLRGQTKPAHRTIALCVWGAGAGSMGRTSTGATCAIRASKRGSSARRPRCCEPRRSRRSAQPHHRGYLSGL